MFPGTQFLPAFHYYEVGATTPPVSSGGVANYGATAPAPSGITKLHWRYDYANNSSWTASSFPGYEKPDGYSADGYGAWANNCLTNKIAKDLPLNNGVNLLSQPPGTYVIKIPEDVAMGSKGYMIYSAWTQLWYPDPAVLIGNFPYGSTIIIHNHGIIAGAGGTGGAGGGVYVAATVNNDAIGGGGGGGAGLHDTDLPFEQHEQGDNWGVYPLDANKTSGGPNPDQVFAGSGGTPALKIAVFSIIDPNDDATYGANGGFGPGDMVSTDNATGGVGITTPTGITMAGIPATSSVGATGGNKGGDVFSTTGQNNKIWIYNHSTGKILGGGGGGGGGAGIANDARNGGDGGDPGEAGEAGAAVPGFAAGGVAGAAGIVFTHHSFWDQDNGYQSKFIIKQNDGTIKGQGSAFTEGSEH